jgi:demethylmenaquinone methyltransferase/2-methoxy-6-polyprenyl-1,4-benzoquinol methylase
MEIESMQTEQPRIVILDQKHSPNPEVIRQMFSKVAKNYDRGNNILSMGIHHLWRKKLVKLSGAKPGQSVLDCATGTGDLAIEFKQAVGTAGKVVGTDFCLEMLGPAPAKAAAKKLDIQFESADVTKLQYPDNSFDICSISFGIRNVGDPVKGLSEMARVTKSGGHVMVLEFGQVYVPVFGPLYNFYSEKVLPKLGGLVTGQGEAYEYLQRSSSAFPCREKFIDLMKQTNQFSDMTYTSLTGGIAYIYKGTVR